MLDVFPIHPTLGRGGTCFNLFLTTTSTDRKGPLIRGIFGSRSDETDSIDRLSFSIWSVRRIAAEHCTPAQMAFMIRKSTGIVCVTTGKERLERFGLHPATGKNTDPNGTNFYVSTDYLGAGVTTGVSAKVNYTILLEN